MRYLGKITDPKDLVNKEYVDDINTSIQAELDTKANTDGAYESMTVGNAEQLVSTVMVNDKAPYLFRTSGGSADIGNREYDTLVGGTIAWNQLAGANPRSVATIELTIIYDSSTHVYSVTGTASGSNYIWLDNTTAISGHKYLINCSDASPRMFCEVNSFIDFRENVIISADVSGTLYYGIHPSTGTEYSSTFTLNAFDLTQMFGSTIADYAYTLESGTAGAGIAWLKSYGFFTKPYYPYNAGTLFSVADVSAHEMTGFNQWDEEWELGYWTTTGAKVQSSSRIRCTNPIPVLPSTVYYKNFSTSEFGLVYLDESLKGISTNFGGAGTFTTPSNCRYVVFSVSGTTYNNDICINLSWSGYRNGEYEPYVKHSYPLDSDLRLRGIPVLDANNNLYYDGDTYEADGTVTRRYGTYTFTGNETWAGWSSSISFCNELQGLIKPASSNSVAVDYIVTDASVTIKAPNSIGTDGNGMGLTTGGAFVCHNNDRASLTGKTIVYELRTQTTETADPYSSPQIVNDFGTERYVVTAQSGVEVPVGHSTDYPKNLRDLLQHQPDLSDDGDGTYVIQQIGTQMSLIPFIIPEELPDAPAEDGTYTLQVLVAEGTATYSWVSAT